MRTEWIICANVFISLFYLSNGLTSETIIVSLAMAAWSMINLFLYSKKKIPSVPAILLSSITTAVWFTQPLGVLLAFIPITFILFGGIKGHTDNIYVIGWDIRAAVIVYGTLMYGIKLLMLGFDLQELGLLAAAVIGVSIFCESFRRNAGNIRIALAKEKVTSTYDKLTGLLSRTTIEGTILDAAKKIDNFFLIMIDVDNFKGINDAYGHLNGDIILQDLSLIIKQNIRETDLAFRYGGDEFIILCSKIQAADVQDMAEEIRRNFNEKSYHYNQGEQHFHISLGVAECKYGEFESVADIIKKADQALYQSKKKGRNMVSVYADGKESK